MDSVICNVFKGKINGVEITDQVAFNSCCYLIEEMEDHFDIEIKDEEFTRDFTKAVKNIICDAEFFDPVDDEKKILNSIRSFDFIEQLRLTYDGDEDEFEELNKKIATKEYEFLKGRSIYSEDGFMKYLIDNNYTIEDVEKNGIHQYCIEYIEKKYPTYEERFERVKDIRLEKLYHVENLDKYYQDGTIKEYVSIVLETLLEDVHARDF